MKRFAGYIKDYIQCTPTKHAVIGATGYMLQGKAIQIISRKSIMHMSTRHFFLLYISNSMSQTFNLNGKRKTQQPTPQAFQFKTPNLNFRTSVMLILTQLSWPEFKCCTLIGNLQTIRWKWSRIPIGNLLWRCQLPLIIKTTLSPIQLTCHGGFLPDINQGSQFDIVHSRSCDLRNIIIFIPFLMLEITS